MLHNGQNISASGFWDKTGALVSWLCALHCLAMPFLVSSLSIAGLGFFAHDGVEYIFIGISIFVALISILSGFAVSSKYFDADFILRRDRAGDFRRRSIRRKLRG